MALVRDAASLAAAGFPGRASRDAAVPRHAGGSGCDRAALSRLGRGPGSGGGSSTLERDAGGAPAGSRRACRISCRDGAVTLLVGAAAPDDAGSSGMSVVVAAGWLLDLGSATVVQVGRLRRAQAACSVTASVRLRSASFLRGEPVVSVFSLRLVKERAQSFRSPRRLRAVDALRLRRPAAASCG